MTSERRAVPPSSLGARVGAALVAPLPRRTVLGSFAALVGTGATLAAVTRSSAAAADPALVKLPAGLAAAATDPAWELTVARGSVSFSAGAADLVRFPGSARLALRGASGSAGFLRLAGVALADLLAAVGAQDSARLRVVSLDPRTPPRTVLWNARERSRSLVALYGDGHLLDAPSGGPAALVADGAPAPIGWLSRIEVLS